MLRYVRTWHILHDQTVWMWYQCTWWSINNEWIDKWMENIRTTNRKTSWCLERMLKLRHLVCTIEKNQRSKFLFFRFYFLFFNIYFLQILAVAWKLLAIQWVSSSNIWRRFPKIQILWNFLKIYQISPENVHTLNKIELWNENAN